MSYNIRLIENIDLDEFKNNLKFAREDRSITIEQASKILNIHINVLENIENGEFDKLSNDVFTMGHIKTYLNWLGIDPKLIKNERKKSDNINLNKKKYKVILPNNLKISKFYISLSNNESGAFMASDFLSNSTVSILSIKTSSLIFFVSIVMYVFDSIVVIFL